jgi:hypothetical protein
MKIKIFFVICLLFTGVKIFAQGNPPKPLDMPFLNLIEGAWQGESDILGTKMTETLLARMDFNKQYLILDLTAMTEDKTHTYRGMGVIGIDGEGNAKSWWFDDWGVSAVSSGTGKLDALTLTLESQRSDYKINRVITLTGGQLVMKFNGSMKGTDGKEVPITGETVYNKTK